MGYPYDVTSLEAYNMQVGDLLLFYQQSPPVFSMANLVRLITGSHYHHIAIVYSPPCGLIAESMAEGFIVRKRLDLKELIDKGWIHVFRPKKKLTNKERDALICEIERRYQRPYGFRDWFGLLFYYLFTNQWIFPKSPKHMTCAEAVERVYQSIERPLVPSKDADAVTPGDQAKSKKLFRIV